MKNILICLIVLLLQSMLISQNSSSIFVNDPQDWRSGRGSIENLDINVKTKGMFAEVSYTFDLSTNEYFQEDTQIEWVFSFAISDSELVFNDSWLWIDDYISKGEVYDKAEGVDIYEGIVNRRQDPSILTKETDQNYVLKVYPLFADSTRRVKLSYITPLQMNGDNAHVDIDVSIFRASNRAIQNASLQIADNNLWQHDPLASSFIEMEESIPLYTSYAIPSIDNLSTIQIDFARQLSQGEVFVGTYSDGEDQFYQLNFIPMLDDDRPPTYHVFGIDYGNQDKPVVDIDNVLSTIERHAISNLQDQDFINFVYSDFGHTLYADAYFPATDANIRAAIQQIREDIDGLGDFLEGLTTGVNFILEQDQDATYTLVSSSSSYGSQEDTEDIMSELGEVLDNTMVDVDINVVNNMFSGRTYWINNVRYIGNAYLYNRLAGLTEGNVYDISNYALDESLDIITSGTIKTDDYDLDIDTEDGFTYGNYFNALDQGLALSSDISIVGKYYGDFPMTVELQGLYEDQYFDYTFTVDAEDVVPLSAFAKSAWTSQYILDNEDNRNPNTQQQVVYVSKEERLLSTLTTFLCLEGDSIQSEVSTITDNDVLIATENVEPTDVGVAVYPNPSSESFTIEVPVLFARDLTVDHVAIFDHMGKRYRSADLTFAIEEDTQYITWIPSKDVKPGMYILQIRNGDKVINLKVIYIK